MKKTNVITLEQGRQQLAEQKNADEKTRMLERFGVCWLQMLEMIQAEFPDIAVVAVQCDVLQPPSNWSSLCWSATLKDLKHLSGPRKGQKFSDGDVYGELGKFRKALGEMYTSLAVKKVKRGKTIRREKKV